jgi:hypothetical protein
MRPHGSQRCVFRLAKLTPRQPRQPTFFSALLVFLGAQRARIIAGFLRTRIGCIRSSIHAAHSFKALTRTPLFRTRRLEAAGQPAQAAFHAAGGMGVGRQGSRKLGNGPGSGVGTNVGRVSEVDF